MQETNPLKIYRRRNYLKVTAEKPCKICENQIFCFYWLDEKLHFCKLSGIGRYTDRQPDHFIKNSNNNQKKGEPGRVTSEKPFPPIFFDDLLEWWVELYLTDRARSRRSFKPVMNGTLQQRRSLRRCLNVNYCSRLSYGKNL